MEFFFNVNTGRIEQRPIDQGIPFKSMAEIAAENANSNLFAPLNTNQFTNSVGPFPPPLMAVAPMDVNTGILRSTPAGRFLDNAGLPPIDTSFGVANEPDSEEDADEARKRSSGGIANLFRALLGFAVPGANLILGGLEGIKSLNQRFRNTDFGRSTSLADYLQRRRDRKARELAAQRGADKQRIQKLREFNENAGRYFSGNDGSDSGRAGGFGQGAGDFSPSEPTATEGSF
jgi:hypothetical protein|tara:strand:- start:269 stop:964 length:696 start_codon:yes stop_codon:yes gene_type:complete